MSSAIRRVLLVLAAALFGLASAACGKHFDVKTAPGFVQLKDQEPSFDWRAVAPDGVAMAVRVVDLDDEGDLGFWAHAVELTMREMDGYALLRTADVRSANGAPGRELVFGHDENGKPFVYRVRLLLPPSTKRLVVVEAGGAKAQMDRYAPSLEWMMASVEAR